jgi:hypothetical protein
MNGLRGGHSIDRRMNPRSTMSSNWNKSRCRSRRTHTHGWLIAGNGIGSSTLCVFKLAESIHLIASILDSRPKIRFADFGYGPRLGCGAVELANFGLFSLP